MISQGQFALITFAGWLVVVLAALRFRNRSYATFRAVLLGIHGLLTTAMFGYLDGLPQIVPMAFLYAHACVHVQSIRLIWPDMRSLAYRLLVSMPEAFFLGASVLSLPWAVSRAIGYPLPWFWLPYLIGALGLAQALSSRKEEVHLVVADGAVTTNGSAAADVRRHPRGEHRDDRPLRIVQITDPHLGPFMSMTRLRGICERAVASEPDLVLLTGDFMTMESQKDRDVLAGALAPLAALPGRVFGCMGNHDLEAPETVFHAFKQIGANMLIDTAVEVETPAGSVQLLGADFKWRERGKHLTELCEQYPRSEAKWRLLMLHDPGAFKDLPEGEADLVFSGHTHGGQLGLVSFGLVGTIISAFSKMPDHGFFARGRDRLYVHRGTGHYGFPLRLGVPAEESVVCLHQPALDG